MNNILRWYNRNRKMFWIVILTIIAVIVLIQTLNSYYKNNTKDKSSSTNASTTTYNNNYSIITGEEIDETVSDKSIDLIKNFFDYCNSKDIESAYNLLSTECKEELYPTRDDFIQKYYNRIFTEKRSYDSNLWITTSNKNTYRVEIMSDLLSTGQRDYMPIEDYYTIIYENGQYKLNISNYIGKEDIDISTTQNSISVKIISKKMYMNYEIYEIEVKNNTGSKLIFNTKENTKSIYLQDKNELKYIAFLNEIPDNEFEILNGMTKTLEIKFNRGYKPTTKIEKIIFEDISISNNQQKQNIEMKF